MCINYISYDNTQHIYFGIVCGVRFGARFKNSVWSPAGCPYIYFAVLNFENQRKMYIFQNKTNLSTRWHTPFWLRPPNTLLPDTAKPPGHPKFEIVKTANTPHKIRFDPGRSGCDAAALSNILVLHKPHAIPGKHISSSSSRRSPGGA